jgi:hypothetical protein
LGLSEGIYDLVFESFWDLFCLKSVCEGISPKKLQLWIQKVNLNVAPRTKEDGQFFE